VRQFLITTADQRDRLFQFLSKRELPMQVDVGEPREPRSVSQNSRLWALHALASKETGYTPEELHELALARHFGTKEVSVGGFTKIVPLKRSSAREKKEFHEFLEATEAFYAAELGVWLGMEEMA
jgi:hypothetical protein